MALEKITLDERNKALAGFAIEDKNIIKKAKRNPLTLNLQHQMAGNVGAGNVNFSFKRLNLMKQKTKKNELSRVNLFRKELLSREIKEKPIIKEEIGRAHV